MKKVKYLGHLWYIIGKSSLGPKYVVAKRVSFLSDLKRYGQVATQIDMPKKELIWKTNMKYNLVARQWT